MQMPLQYRPARHRKVFDTADNNGGGEPQLLMYCREETKSVCEWLESQPAKRRRLPESKRRKGRIFSPTRHRRI